MHDYYCTQPATLNCPNDKKCTAKYCDKDCVDIHWLLDHKMTCGAKIGKFELSYCWQIN